MVNRLISSDVSGEEIKGIRLAFDCDKCGKEVYGRPFENDKLWQCKACKYDLCEDCYIDPNKHTTVEIAHPELGGWVDGKIVEKHEEGWVIVKVTSSACSDEIKRSVKMHIDSKNIRQPRASRVHKQQPNVAGSAATKRGLIVCFHTGKLSRMSNTTYELLRSGQGEITEEESSQLLPTMPMVERCRHAQTTEARVEEDL